MKKRLVSIFMAAVLAVGLATGITNKIKGSNEINTSQVTESNIGIFGSDEPDPW